MSNLIAKSNLTVIIGMGVTGRSAARYLLSKGQPFVWLDTRKQPPSLDEVLREFPDVHYELGELNPETLMAAEEIIVSPGVAISTPAIIKAIDAGVKLIGDIDLFLREVDAPVIAITGSNAKSTVTALVGEMAKVSGRQVGVGGNIGLPVLQLLTQEKCDLYVLELSSFQLETIEKLNANVATVLNVSEDHMDRYRSLAHYHQTKQRIYYGARAVVFNRDDALSKPPMASGIEYYSFGMGEPDRHGFGLIKSEGIEYLAFEFKPLMPVTDIRLRGRHNTANALAALALGHAAGLPMASMLEALKTFAGLAHRCQWVGAADDVSYYNDSKGTNVGATLAALSGLSVPGHKIVLIAGGVGKGADFSPLKALVGNLRALVVMGQDGALIAEQLSESVPVTFVESMKDAVVKAKQQSQPGDCVLLSPACASFDMFNGFEDRGNQFEQAVREVAL